MEERRSASVSGAGRPPTAWLALEGVRALAELSATQALLPLLRRSGQSDGAPVLVLPGVTGDYDSTRPLRWFLKEWGYTPYRWELGPNLGPTDPIVDGLAARVAAGCAHLIWPTRSGECSPDLAHP